MTSPRSWSAYPCSYRAKEMAILASWLRAGEGGSVIGLAGAGKSNLLGFLCNRPEVLRSYLPDGVPPIALVWVDLNSLPASGAADVEATLYRVILRALYEAWTYLPSVDHSLAESVGFVYRRVEDKTDPFLTQSALRETLILFQDQDTRLVLVLDPFDTFCRTAPMHVLDSIRGLRDSFKDTLSCVVGLRKELAVLRDPADMGELYEILDTHQCPVGAMEPDDARWVVRQVEETTGRSFSKTQCDRLLELSGAYPSLLRAVGLWLADTPSPPPEAEWAECLLAERSARYRLEELWAGLPEEAQRALSEVQHLPPVGRPSRDRAVGGVRQQHGKALAHLSTFGLCEPSGDGWCVRGELLAAYVSRAAAQTVDEIWLDEKTGELQRGPDPLMDLAPLEREALLYLVAHPRIRHTKTDLILNAWPNDPCPLERTDDSVYQVIRGLRSKIEPDPSRPRYIVTWRGTGAHEGGYQFFPCGI